MASRSARLLGYQFERRLHDRHAEAEMIDSSTRFASLPTGKLSRIAESVRRALIRHPSKRHRGA